MTEIKRTKSREEYIKNICPGNIVAFNSGEYMFSGRVIDFSPTNRVVIKTRNGSVFFVERNDIVWVKTGSKWPLGIYNALKLKQKEN